MSKPKKTRTVTTEEFVDPDLAPAEEPIEDDLAQVLGELVDSGGGSLKIERHAGGALEFVDEWDAGAFTFKALQEQYGGGKYRLTAKDAARRFRFQRTVAVAAPRVVPSTEPAALDKLAEVMRAFMDQQNKILALLAGRQQAPGVTSDQVRSAVLSDLQAMRQIVGGDSGNSTEKLMEALKLGVELAREGAGGESDNLVPVIGKFLDTFGQPLAEAMTARAVTPPPALAPPPRVTPAPAPVSPGAGASPGQPGKEQKPMMNTKMREAVAFLVERAQSDADVGLYADLILDNIPESILRPILDGDVVERLAALDQRVRENAEWFRDLGAVLREALADAAGPGSEPAAGDGGPGETPAGS